MRSLSLPDEGVDRLIIGSFSSIGSGASFIMAGNQGHRNEWISSFPFYWMSNVEAFDGAENGYLSAGDTMIGNDVWIRSETVIMLGTRIGDGAVIGTRALVTRDVEPYSIVGGNPAKMIRKRLDDRQIELLLQIRWWDWQDEQLKTVMPILTSGDVDALHRYLMPAGF